jgi:hypothetical protein
LLQVDLDVEDLKDTSHFDDFARMPSYAIVLAFRRWITPVHLVRVVREIQAKLSHL